MYSGLDVKAHHANSQNEINGVLGHDSAFLRLHRARADEMNIFINHAPGAGSMAQPVDQQSSALQLYHGCPDQIHYN